MKKEEKVRWLNALRGMAALIVLLSHLGSISGNYGEYFNGCGKIGVWLFMVLSGFWFMYPRRKRNAPLNIRSLGLFYLQRILRLMPVYLIVLFAAWGIGVLPDFRSVARHIILLDGSAHFWYMPVIVRFFMIAPVFWLICSKIRRDALLPALFVVIAIIVSFMFPYTKYPENSLQLRWYLPVFLMGFLLAFWFSKIKAYREGRGGIDILAIIFAALICICTPWAREKIWNKEPSAWLQNKYLLIGALWCACIVAIAYGIWWKRMLEGCRFLQWIGDISYPLYLIHYPIMLKVNQLGIAWWQKAAAALCISGALAWILHQCVERPMKSLL